MEIPRVGYGTANVYREDVERALRRGYRHLDCARMYGNEDQVGEAIRRSGVDRSELFVTSKLYMDCHAADDVDACCRASLRDLGLDWLDLLLVHWPLCFLSENSDKKKSLFALSTETNLVETWVAMQDLQRRGLVKRIGVSNFDRCQLECLFGHLWEGKEEGEPHRRYEDCFLCDARSVPRDDDNSNNDSNSNDSNNSNNQQWQRRIHTIPFANQVELHPGFPQDDLVSFLHSKGIVPVAWGPCNKGKQLSNPVLMDIYAQKQQQQNQKDCISPLSLQALSLAWNLQRGVVVIPTSTNEEHMASNLALSRIVTDTDNNNTDTDNDTDNEDTHHNNNLVVLTSDEVSRITHGCRNPRRRFPDLIGIWPNVDNDNDDKGPRRTLTTRTVAVALTWISWGLGTAVSTVQWLTGYAYAYGYNDDDDDDDSSSGGIDVVSLRQWYVRRTYRQRYGTDFVPSTSETKDTSRRT